MDRSILKTGILSLVVATALAACSATNRGSSDPDPQTPSNETTVGAAVGAVFGSQGDAAALKVAAAAVKAVEENERPSACDMAAEEGPSGVETSLSVSAGTYGMSGNSVTVSEEDGCDQGGEYASFGVTEHQLTCTDGNGNETTVVMQESSGVFRENLDLDRTEIYGTFNLLFPSDGSSETVSDLACSLTIDRDQQFDGGCQDGEGETIEPSDDVTCVDNE